MRPLRYLLATLLLFAPAFAQMSHEEQVVRTAYAKLSYAVDINNAYRLIVGKPSIDPAKLIRSIEEQALQFDLSNFVTGNLSDIANVKYADAFGQYPDGQDVIQVALSTPEWRDAKGKPVRMEGASASWVHGPEGTAPNMSVQQMMPIMQKESKVSSALVRYCRYTVKVTLEGKTRTYDSSFLFAANGDAIPGDVVAGLGGGPLRHFISSPAYPTILLNTSLATNRAVRNYLESTQKADASCAKVGDACCDVAAMSCGVPSAEIRRLP